MQLKSVHYVIRTIGSLLAPSHRTDQQGCLKSLAKYCFDELHLLNVWLWGLKTQCDIKCLPCCLLQLHESVRPPCDKEHFAKLGTDHSKRISCAKFVGFHSFFCSLIAVKLKQFHLKNWPLPFPTLCDFSRFDFFRPGVRIRGHHFLGYITTVVNSA